MTSYIFSYLVIKDEKIQLSLKWKNLLYVKGGTTDLREILILEKLVAIKLPNIVIFTLRIRLIVANRRTLAKGESNNSFPDKSVVIFQLFF